MRSLKLALTTALLASLWSEVPHGQAGTVGVWQNITPPQVPLPGPAPCDYGTLAFVVDTHTPSTIYLGTCQHGIYKSTNSGASWTHVNTGANAAIIDNSRQWTMVIDPVDPQV